MNNETQDLEQYIDHPKWYGPSEGVMEQVRHALLVDDASAITILIRSLHPADVAVIIENLSSDDRTRFIELVHDQLDPEILPEMYADVRAEILRHLSDEEIAEALIQLDSDDALSVLNELDEDHQKIVLQDLPEDQRLKLEQSLAYPEYSAGRLMQREMVVMRSNWTIQKTIDMLRTPKKSRFSFPETFYEIFIVSKDYKPVGKIALNSLFKYSENTTLQEIMDKDVKSIPLTMHQEDVGFLFRQYSFVTAPVVDYKGRLVGMITIDDVLTEMEEEATEDIMKLGGVGESDFHAGTLNTTISRLRWLLVTFIDTLLASAVIYQFQGILEKKVALAILMPIVAAMGGNAGMQGVTVMVRALATHEFRTTRIWSIIGKELRVGLINGLVFAGLLASIASFWFQDIALGLVLAAAMVFNIVWAALAGTALPILLYRFDFDPAISSGPLLTTTTDVLGFAVFLGLATLVLG
jgi:magnesium transporter